MARTGTGINAPITTGNGVYYQKDQVGAGPDEASANAYLQNRLTNAKHPLWVYDFSSDFSATGTEGQSRMKKDFFPRFFTQPRYLIKGQTANQYEYLKLAKFIRQGMLMQVASAPLIKNNPQFEAFVLRIEGRRVKGINRTMRGGHAGWTLEGYIENANAGGERFKFAPEYEFTFVLANAVEGPMQILDTTYIPTQIANVREAYLAGFNKMIPLAELQDTGKKDEKGKDKPTSPPKFAEQAPPKFAELSPSAKDKILDFWDGW